MRSVWCGVCSCRWGSNVNSKFVEIRPTFPEFFDCDPRTVHQSWRCLASVYRTHYDRRSFVFQMSAHLVISWLVFFLAYGCNFVCDQLFFLLPSVSVRVDCSLAQMDNFVGQVGPDPINLPLRNVFCFFCKICDSYLCQYVRERIYNSWGRRTIRLCIEFGCGAMYRVSQKNAWNVLARPG